MPAPLEQHRRLVAAQRVARLATADAQGTPHAVPVCFAFDGASFYIALDRKPKRTEPRRLRRVRNIQENPQVALLLDHYEEAWDRLWFVLVQGHAALLEPGEEQQRAVALLREKYPQDRAMPLEESPVIRVTPQQATAWGSPPTSAA